MKYLLVLVAFLASTVLCRVAYNLKSDNEDPFTEQLEELKALINLTKQMEVSKEYSIPLGPALSLRNDNVIFYVNNRKNMELQEVKMHEASNILDLCSFDVELETIVIIHGWHNKYISEFNTLARDTFLQVRDVNIISINWDEPASGSYLTAYVAVPQVGKLVGQFINTISATYNYPLEKISVVGHSLGAHISGFAGRETGGKLNSITGLDPAGVLYFHGLPNMRLSENDAQYVQVIHTDASILGARFNIGHADYWPNGGYLQPGCLPEITGCSHSRSYYYFVESLSSNNFISKQCDSYFDYCDKECKQVPVTTMGGAYFNKTIFGNYYLKVASSSPYALGDIGL